MGESKNTFLVPVLLLTFSLGFVGCARNSDDGGQSTGGGFTEKSTPQDVNETLDLAIKLATEQDPQKNIYVQYWLSKGPFNDIAEIQKPLRLFPQFTDGKPTNLDQFISPMLAAFGKNKISRIPSGDCGLGPGETTTDASVSTHDLNAEICFSVGNLSHVAPTDLLRQVMGLVLHEAIHLGGGGEDEARAWQNDFIQYFGIRFGDISKGSVENDTIKAFENAKTNLEKARQLAAKNTSDPLIYTFVGKFNEQLAQLPDVFDPMALEIKTKPSQPELIDNYTNATLALLEKVKMKFETPVDVVNVRGIRVIISFMSPELVVSSLTDISKTFDIVVGNFQAFIGNSKAPYKSDCILPEGPVTVLVPPDGSAAPLSVLPPRKCVGGPILESKPVEIEAH